MLASASPLEGTSSPTRRLSHLLHVVSGVTSRAGAGAVVAVAVLIAAATLGALGFPEAPVAAFATISASVTVVMTFVIQHTQSRQQLATQLKLDELIRSSPHADDLLVHLESADDGELIARERDQINHHAAQRLI